jgi:PAS domain S-box-containing protein
LPGVVVEASVASAWRIIATGVPPGVARSLVLAAANEGDPGFVDVDAFAESDWEGLRPGARDVFLVWTNESAEAGLARVGAVQAKHPWAPIVARVPRGRSDLALGLLRAGVLEVFAEPGLFGEALERARARAASTDRLRPNPASRPAADEPDRPLDGLFPNLFDWIYVLGVAEDGVLTFQTVNPPLNAGIGFLNPDFAGRTVERCLEGADAAQLVQHLERVTSAGKPVQFEEEHLVGGRMRVFQTVLTPVRNKWGRIHRVAGISRDITALKEALAALRASEERLAHALEGTQQALWDWDLGTGRLYRSPRWFEMLGLAPSSVDPTLEAGLEHIHPEDRRQTEAALNAHLEGRLPRYQAEYRVRTKAGEWIWIFDAGKIVSWDAANRPTRLAGTCTDITERRRAEESLRALVGGVVHEIRNPVYGISINLDALEATFGADPRYASFVSALRESAERISSLMNDLRDYGEPRTLNPEPCRVSGLLDGAWRSCEAAAAAAACTVRIDLEDPGLVLPLNARRMHQVFRNLLENALQHAPRESVVAVTARRTRAAGHDWWAFSVDDTGPGFEGDALPRAFEPFFTRRAGGTGLGLSIVKRVVEEHGGTVEATNRPEGGARVVVRLPAPRLRMELPEAAHA